MSFDPSGISTIADNAPNPAQSQQNALTLADSNNRVQLNSLTLAGAKEEQSDRLQAKKIMQGSDLSTDKGVNEAAEKIAKVSPDLAMKFKKETTQQKSADLGVKLQQLQVAEEQGAPLVASIDGVLGQLSDMKKKVDEGKATPAELNAATMKIALPEIQRLSQEHPELAPHLNQFLQNPKNLTYEGLMSQERQTKKGREMLKQQLDEIKSAQSQARLETYQNNEQSLEKERLSMEKHRLALETSKEKGENSKPESGYEWVDPKDHSQGEKPIKGGSKDSEKPMSGREAQMFARITTSANLGIASLKNIVQLPSGASTGLFGVGSSPGTSILGAAKGALTNKVASQDVQDYNVMIAGLSRNLSTIETQGLAPPGSFTQSLSAIQLREGDTEFTKLKKIAESRQIIEKGLEPSLDSPRVPKEQKEGIRKMIAELKEAVPFTNEDIIKLQRGKNPKETIQDVMKKRGLTKSGGSGAANMPKQGDVMDGYRFKGGNPADQSSWDKVQ